MVRKLTPEIGDCVVVALIWLPFLSSADCGSALLTVATNTVNNKAITLTAGPLIMFRIFVIRLSVIGLKMRLTRETAHHYCGERTLEKESLKLKNASWIFIRIAVK